MREECNNESLTHRGENRSHGQHCLWNFAPRQSSYSGGTKDFMLVAHSPGVSINGSIHSATSFPQPILTVSSFNSTLFNQNGKVISSEGCKNVDVGSPECEITPPAYVIDPRWGRGQETPGEDPHLTSVYAEYFVRGLQEVGDYDGNATSPASDHFKEKDAGSPQTNLGSLDSYMEQPVEQISMKRNVVEIAGPDIKHLLRNLFRLHWSHLSCWRNEIVAQRPSPLHQYGFLHHAGKRSSLLYELNSYNSPCPVPHAVVNPDMNGNPPGIMREELADALPPLLEQTIRRLVQWHYQRHACQTVA